MTSAPRRPDHPSDTPPEGAVMLIDCDTCAARNLACGDCVVTVLLGAPPAVAGDGVELDGAERAAIAVLAGSGLVPPLRLRPAGDGPHSGPVRSVNRSAGSAAGPRRGRAAG